MAVFIFACRNIYVRSMSLQSRIAKKFRDGTYKDIGFSELCKEVGAVTESDVRLLRSVLSNLKRENVIYFDRGVYKLSKYEKLKNPSERKKAQTVIGVIRANERGFGFLITDNGDYYLSQENMGYALHGDRCECAVIDGNGGKRDAAIVLKVLEHTITRLAGVYFTEGAFSYLRPDEQRYLSDILLTDLNGFTPAMGDKIFVEITSFPKKACPQGRIVALLGRQFELAAEENAILYNCGFYEGFPETVKTAASKIEATVADNRLIDRLNLTDKLIFTIDGDDAKDFDDAVSLEFDEVGNYILGVHIADVSEYVTNKSDIDKEAYKRGTSAYFPDKVVPMLPFELSNGICSLSENNLRLTVSVFATIDKEGNVIDRSFHESYIKSAYRLTYDKVQRILDGDKDLLESYKNVAETLNNMLELKNVLEKKRSKDGYIDLSVKEGDVFFDGKQITVGLHKATDATRIIEQFMITANELVAEYLFYSSLPCVYRIHEKPDKEKTAAFKNFLKALGINVTWRRDELFPSDYQRILENLKDTSKFAVVNRAMLRSMKKAVYSSENVGHFGLASKCYCHFTSPIRRYPDLVVHRILKAVLRGEVGSIIDLYGDFLYEVAQKCTQNERRADEAERAIDDLYKVKYLENYIDCEFSGVISGVTQHGLFVELENTCEGFIPIELLAGNFDYDETTFSLISKKRAYRLGDKIDIVVVGVDIGERKAQFMPAFYLRGLQNKKKYGRIK